MMMKLKHINEAKEEMMKFFWLTCHIREKTMNPNMIIEIHVMWFEAYISWASISILYIQEKKKKTYLLSSSMHDEKWWKIIRN